MSALCLCDPMVLGSEDEHVSGVRSAAPVTHGCSWCGNTMSPEAHFCPGCGAPNRRTGYVLFGLNFVARNFALPLALGFLSFMLTARHDDSERAAAARLRENDRVIAEHGKLMEAYGDFARAHSDYRIAENTIAYMALNDRGEIQFKALTDAILQLDKAFDSVGAKLTPFEEFERAEPGYKSPYASGRTPLEETWQDCFIQPYFSTDPKIGHSYQQDIAAQLKKCEGAVCSLDVVRGVKLVIANIDSGRCTNALPAGTAHPFESLWAELSRIVSAAASPSGSPAAAGSH